MVCAALEEAEADDDARDDAGDAMRAADAALSDAMRAARCPALVANGLLFVCGVMSVGWDREDYPEQCGVYYVSEVAGL